METRASHVLVGLFVLVLGIATAAFGLWLGRVELDRSVDVYDVEFRSAITGLQNGAQVTYQGIPVGRVTRIGFDPQDVQRVLVRVEVDPMTPVTVDTQAQLAPQGITGIFFVQLQGGTQDSAPLASDPQRPARIPGMPSALDRLATDFPEVLAEGVVLLERAVQLLSDDNIESFGRTLEHLETVTGALAGRRAELDRLVADMAALAGDLRGLTSSVGAAVTSIDATVDDIGARVPDLVRRAGTGLDGLGDAARRIEQAAAQLDGLLRDVREPWRDFSRSGLYELNALIGETRVLVASASRISREFERDPAGFLLGGSFKGFRAD